jgi:beta-glucosidase-like glycosyl hydrolase
MDPRFGRHQEGYSPNPTLTAHYATAAVIGMHGQTTVNASENYICGEQEVPCRKVASLAKHFAGYAQDLMPSRVVVWNRLSALILVRFA